MEGFRHAKQYWIALHHSGLLQTLSTRSLLAVQNCPSTEEPQEELNMKTRVELNLQNHNLPHQKSNIKEEEETYSIPSIINGQIWRKHRIRTIKQRTSPQKRMKLNTSSACRRHKILIIGNNHIRGLSEKVSDCLDYSFGVTGIAKPNADMEASTSPLHLKTENLTKKDLIIFYGGMEVL